MAARMFYLFTKTLNTLGRFTLEPLLFALYVSELPSLVSSKLLMFADGIKRYHTIRSPEDCCRGILMYYLNGQNILRSKY